MAPPSEANRPRGHNETLHDYLTRKGIKCACKVCREERKRLERDNNSVLVLDSPTDSDS